MPVSRVEGEAQKYGFKHNIPLVFVKPSSAPVLKANMKIVGATEYALVLYREKLPKFNNVGEDGQHHMIKNWFEFKWDGKDIPRIHPTQKPVSLLKTLISIFTEIKPRKPTVFHRGINRRNSSSTCIFSLISNPFCVII